MSRPSWHDISPGSLRDHGGRAQLDRVWGRLERDLPGRTPRGDRGVSLWTPAMGLGLFAFGVMVGARFFASPAPMASVAAEPGLAPQRVVVPGALAARDSTTPPEERNGNAIAPALRRAEPASRQHLVRPPMTQSPLVVEEDPTATPPSVAVPPAWLGLADDGRYAEALDAVEGQGGFDVVLRQATPDQLMLLVDVARATGRRERAVTALRRIVNQHGSDPNAPLAAWMLGNELVRAGDTEGASQAFAMYRALSPQGDFAQDALARQFEVAAERQDLEQAEQLAEQYARDFPDGPRREEIGLQLVELRAQLAARLAAEEDEASNLDPVGAEVGSAGGAGGVASEAEAPERGEP